ncbi:MAG: MarR family winged helix-turn-helix transcriptional regulator [Propionibacteriaceae bacterium]
MNSHDEVDEIQRAWQTVRPDLDWTPLAVWSRLHRLAALLENERRKAFSAHQLETWEFDVLAALRRAGAPFRLTPGQLVEQTHVTSGTMTNRIDRLESRSLVERHPNPIDGRGTLVELTAAGKESVDAAITDLVQVERAMGKPLNDQESAKLAELLARIMATRQ